MATKETIATGVTRGVAETVAASLTTALKQVMEHGTEKVKKLVDDLSKDILTPQGILDDSAGAIIKTRYRERNEKNHAALMRLFNFLTKPVQDDFIVISVGILALTASKGEDKTTAGETSAVKSNLMLLGIDFAQAETFSALFNAYDQLVQDFQKLEQEGQANPKSVETLVRMSNFYGDDHLKKKLAGLAMHVRNWKQVLKIGIKTARDFLEDELLDLAAEVNATSQRALERAKRFADQA